MSIQGGGDSSSAMGQYGLPGDQNRRPIGTGNVLSGKHWILMILVIILSLVAYLIIAMKCGTK